ncbi:uncharacterized protein METZ01_LOCUS88120 [marine metagenome]|uniref:Uncharacterized protein n=1 Tax=marine metagenome TaxID=408172 RepID=A0A381V4G3_9ZZZZ
MVWQIKFDVVTWNRSFPKEEIRVITEKEYQELVRNSI